MTGGRGIGRAIVEAYLEEGAHITQTAAREKAAVEGIVREAGTERVLALMADVTNPEECKQVVAKTVE